ncbi:MAG: hypothetical protein LBR28_06205 [Bacteroidales bacterium]|jgi:hypothetical protein|nr:hypothetical protein [Bacteroidales bacterium]
MKVTIHKQLFTLFFTFCLIYPVIFRFLPVFSFRTLYGIISIFFLTVVRNRTTVLNAGIVSIIKILLVIEFFAAITNVVNGTYELFFFKLLYSIPLTILAGITVAWLIKYNHKRIDFDIITNYIIAAATLQCLLAAMMKIFPGFEHFMLEVLTKSEYGDTLEKVKEVRLLGVGGQYVALGIINAFALLMITEKLKTKQKSKLLLLYIFIFIFITVIGSMISRTTVIGTVASIIYLLIFNIKKIMRYVKQIIIGTALVLFIYLVALPPSIKIAFSTYFEYGFEMLFSLQEEGEMKTESTDDLLGMLETTYPKGLKTYAIGDGYWENPLKKYAYYKNTDIGYYRLIWYFGIFGCISYVIYQFIIIWQSNIRTKRKHQMFFILCFILFLILNIKVLVEVIPVFVLFLFAEEKDDKLQLSEVVKNG